MFPSPERFCLCSSSGLPRAPHRTLQQPMSCGLPHIILRKGGLRSRSNNCPSTEGANRGATEGRRADRAAEWGTGGTQDRDRDGARERPLPRAESRGEQVGGAQRSSCWPSARLTFRAGELDPQPMGVKFGLCLSLVVTPTPQQALLLPTKAAVAWHRSLRRSDPARPRA